MVKKALFVRLEAKAGKEEEVAKFIESALPLVQAESATTAWFGIKLGPSTYGIFDAFPDDAGRQALLAGKVAAALKEKAGELFSLPPFNRDGGCPRSEASAVAITRAVWTSGRWGSSRYRLRSCPCSEGITYRRRDGRYRQFGCGYDLLSQALSRSFRRPIRWAPVCRQA